MSTSAKKARQRRFKFFWDTHRWVGIALSLSLIVIAGTGLLLLLKKQFEWIQPPTQKGVEGEVGDFISLERLVEVVLAANNPNFQSFDDIDRVDFRPGKRVHKVRSKHNYAEIQVDAVSGAILSQDSRTSDWIEQIHDGSFFGDPVHDYLMPIVALGLVFLVFSGLYLWLAPKFRRWRDRAART